MMKKRYLFGVYIIIISFIVGCANKNIGYEWLPEAKDAKEILLYNRFEQKLVTYNLDENLVVCRNNEPNYFQFEFEDNLLSNIYTTGHSIDNHYKIIELKNKKINTLYTMEDLEAIFPLAYKNDNELFFIKSYYDTKGNEFYGKRIVCHFNIKEKKLIEYKNTKGSIISKGIYLNNYVYYTVYNIEEDNYQLFRLDDSGKTNTPELVSSSLECPELYAFENKIWKSDTVNIYYNNQSFLKKTLNYFYKDYLIQLEPNLEGNLVLYIFNIKTSDKTLEIRDVVDFRLIGNEILIYTNKKIEKIKL